MATYTSRMVTSTRHEFVVPADRPWGACWAEVMKAIRAAHAELWDKGLVEQDKDAADNVIRILPGDEDVVVFYVLESDGVSTRLV